MRRLLVVTLVLAIVSMVGLAQAADKPDPTGTWKWTAKYGEQTREMTLKLKFDGDKLTGATVGRNGQETVIQDAKYKNGDLSFTVARERNNVKMTSKYAGKVSGDTIKGKIETTRDGQAQSRGWEAQRAKD